MPLMTIPQFSHEEASKFFFKQLNENSLSSFDTILNLEERFSTIASLQKERETKKNIAPYWPIALTHWIDEITKEVEYKPNIYTNNVSALSHLLVRSFTSITYGNDELITEYFHDIMHENYYDRSVRQHVYKVPDEGNISKPLQHIARGVAYAKYLPVLKEELESLLDLHTGEKLSIQPPFTWLGSPSQLGFLYIELIGRGYIKKPEINFQQQAKQLMQVFQIDSTIGTLAKEINENSNSLSPANMKRLQLPQINSLK